MHPYPYSTKSLIACTLVTALMMGCASSPSSPSLASTQRNVQNGKIAGVKSASVIDPSAAASSSGASGTMAGGEATILTVLFADGTQGMYSITQPSKTYVVGAPVQVITDGENITIVSP
jgi:hypothetical protein